MTEFSLEILTPGRRLFEGTVTEVVLPGYKGESGVLGGHENFVGALETGVLKFVHSGNDHWFMLSSGVYEVREGKVSILADMAEEASAVDVEQSQAKVEELGDTLSKMSSFDDTYPRLKLEYDRAQARLQAHRRTQLN